MKNGMSTRLDPFLAGAFALALLSSSAAAQVVLPGAVAPTPGAPAAAGAPSAAVPKPKPEPAATRAPGEETVTDRSLLRNGSTGRLELERRDKTLAVTKLSLAGEQISKAGQTCRVDVAATAIPAVAAQRINGLVRYDVGLPACKFSFEVLDGAVLVKGEQRQCEFVEADCRVEMNGVWGPAAAALNPARAKEIERERAHAENAMRANFKALLARLEGKKDEVKLAAREQAGFSSEREMICRDYAGEERHGFCASRITEGRAVALRAKMGGLPEEKKPPRKPKDAPVQARGPAAGAPTQLQGQPAAPPAQPKPSGGFRIWPF